MTDQLKYSKKIMRANLKKMQAAKKFHPIRDESRIIKYGFNGFSRNIWLSSAATVVMIVTLVILAVTIITSVVLSNTATTMREKIDITIYLKPNLSDDTLNDLSDIISQDANIKSVTISTSEQEYEKIIAETADIENMDEVWEYEGMRETMLEHTPSILRIKVYEIENLDNIKNIVDKDPLFVANIHDEKRPTYDENQLKIARIVSWSNIIKVGGVALGTIFLVVSTLIIFSTIRMAIFSRREEIYMMKLVGANNNFVRGPFLVEAEICGVLAGIIAFVMTVSGFDFFAPRLINWGIDISSMADLFASGKLIIIFIAFIAMGILTSRASAAFAISKYLKKA